MKAAPGSSPLIKLRHPATLFPEIAGPAILVDDLQCGIFLEIPHRRAQPLAVRHQCDATVPRSCESGLGVEQAHRHLVLAGRLMDGEPEVVWKGVFDGPGESLWRKWLAGVKWQWCCPCKGGVVCRTYVSADQHLLGEVLDVPLVAAARPILAGREDVLQVRLKESPISAVRHQGIGLRGDFVVDVEVVLAIFVEEESAEVGGVGDVGDLSECLRKGELDKIFEPGKVNVGEALFDSHGA